MNVLKYRIHTITDCNIEKITDISEGCFEFYSFSKVTHSRINIYQSSESSRLVGILELISFLHPELLLLLCGYMLSEFLIAILLLEGPNPARIPELTRDTKIFAATHQRIGFAAFCSSWNAAGVEVVLFTPGNRDKSIGESNEVSHYIPG